MCSAVFLLLLLPSSGFCVPGDPVQTLLPELQGLVEALPVLVTMLLSGQDFHLGEFSQAADEWFTATIPELRRLIGTFATLTRMALKVADKSAARLDKVEVETAQLIFKGLFVTGEEIIMTVIPILDVLPKQVRNLVPKESILNLLNLDFFKNEIFYMNEDTVKILIRKIKSISSKQREDGLVLLKVLEKMLKLAEEDGDDSQQIEDLFSQVLSILPGQVQNVQNLVSDLALLNKVKKKTVIFNPELRHQEL